MSFIWNWIEPGVTAIARTGIQAGGTLAGNAVGGVGSLVEGAGQSAAQGVQGGVGGVADYINGYGEKIKRSMSADGPVSTPSSIAKKTPVKAAAPAQKKPVPAQKALPASTQAPKKALPSSGGVSKAPPSQKSASTPRPAGQKPPTRAPPKSSGSGVATKSPANSSRPASSTANKIVSTTTPSGKVVISAASKPRPAASKTTARTGNAPTPAPKDPLGIGKDFGKLGSSKPTTRSATQKGPAAAPRKASAADPLALGADIGSIGKKK